MLHQLPSLLARQRGLVTRRQLLELGVPAHEISRMLRAGRLVGIRHGVYADGAVWDSLDEWRGRPILRVRAAHLTIGLRHVFSHDSAALLHRLGVPDPRGCMIHVTRDDVDGDRIRSDIKHHPAAFGAEDVTTVEGLPVLGVARTALDMVREHGLAGGLPACDAALRRGVRRDELWSAADRMRSWPFVRTVREAIGLSDPGAESWLESEGRLLVLELGIGRPQTQFGLRADGRLAFADLRVARHLFEVDGQVKYDTEAAGGLATDPWRVLREEKSRQDFLTGFKLGLSRITAHDCRAGRAQALTRLRRECDDTCRRFGTDIRDLTPYLVERELPRPA